MKSLTTFSKFLPISILTVIVLIPLVYAANQDLQTRDESDDFFEKTGMTVLGVRTEIPTPEITSSIKKKVVLKKESLPREKVKVGFIQEVDNERMQVKLLVGGVVFTIENNASTTFFFGNEDVATFEALHEGLRMYAFGYISQVSSTTLLATKIVIANKSLLRRK